MKKILSKIMRETIICSCGNKFTTKARMIKEDGNYGFDIFIPKCKCGKYHEWEDLKTLKHEKNNTKKDYKSSTK